jgi:hypothetical protein
MVRAPAYDDGQLAAPHAITSSARAGCDSYDRSIATMRRATRDA